MYDRKKDHYACWIAGFILTGKLLTLRTPLVLIV
jgi:hypothetical protein